jgi:hypothetical protein
MTGAAHDDRADVPSPSRDRLAGPRTGGDPRQGGRSRRARTEGTAGSTPDHRGPDLERLAKVLVAIAIRVVTDGEDEEDE